MKRVIAPLAIAACMLLPSVGAALAGQPGTNAGVNCGTTGRNRRYHSWEFRIVDENGISHSRVESQVNVYATRLTVVARNHQMPHFKPTSQYDIACVNVTTHQPP